MTPCPLVSDLSQADAEDPQSERGPLVFAETPRTILLVGALGAPEIMSIANYCDQLHRGGQAALHLNMAGVTDCHRAGLDGLQALAAGPSTMTISISGARWGQFMVLLSRAPMLEVQDLCDSVRALIRGAPPSIAGATGEPKLA
ncbi:hypothetical protein GCM10023203_35960 [Actinomycetospora straminea]|uniref:STAS domain-containing protein n=1 Tax=Actinomycetospora straminea TaxID=663607 RepID=A0ABP9EK90_9PSEU